MLLRYERKYLVPNEQMDALRSRLMTFVRPDTYASKNEKGLHEYVVRSIYFDSHNLISYYEKGDGIMFRRKFRIRGYDNYEEGCKVVFEIKRKIENRIRKHRAFMYFDDMDSIFSTKDVERYVVKDKNYETAVDEARRFFYHIVKYQFKPTVLVVYNRVAYHGKFDSGTRITFDKNIRSRNFPQLHQLYSNDNLTYLFRSHFILEIKYYGDTMPGWARGIVQDYKLRHEALSKYTIGYDVNTTHSLQLY